MRFQFIPFLGIVFLSVAANASRSRGNRTSSDGVSDSAKEARFLSLFNRVIFRQEVCTGTGDDENIQGVCLSSNECNDAGGAKIGNCAAGFGTCCMIVTTECGATITRNNTYIRNPEYPSRSTKKQLCVWGLERQDSNICHIRLDFVRLEVADPDVTAAADKKGDCESDLVKFTQGNGGIMQDICGKMNGQHMYLDAGPEEDNLPVTITLDNNQAADVTKGRIWNIRVAQIPCSTSYTPWPGCRQYFTEVAGNFQSYNYEGQYHLNLMEYTICIRRNKGFCQIVYRQADTEKSFKLTNVEAHVLHLNGRSNCNTDYANIILGTGAVNTCNMDVVNEDGGAATPVIPSKYGHRYCGSGLGCTHQVQSQRGAVTQIMSPFEFGLHSDRKDTNNEEQSWGFNIDFLQIPCV